MREVGTQRVGGPRPGVPVAHGDYILVSTMDEARRAIEAGELPVIVPPGAAMDALELEQLRTEQWEGPSRIFGVLKRDSRPVLIQRDDVGRLHPEILPLNAGEIEGQGQFSGEGTPLGLLTPLSSRPTVKDQRFAGPGGPAPTPKPVGIRPLGDVLRERLGGMASAERGPRWGEESLQAWTDSILAGLRPLGLGPIAALAMGTF